MFIKYKYKIERKRYTEDLSLKIMCLKTISCELVLLVVYWFYDLNPKVKKKNKVHGLK